MIGHVIALPAAVGDDGDPARRLGALFDVHHQRLFRLARRLACHGEDAHDLVQETFLRAARSPHSVPHGQSSEEAWLVRVLINISRDRWRAAGVRARAVHERRLEPDPATPSSEHALVAHMSVHRALDRIAPRRRAILVLHELEGAGVKDIARLLGVTAVTVRWHLSVGRREMARVLGAGSEP